MTVLLERGIPTDRLDEVARKEKLGRPPISEMHYWWTRKPLIVSRAVILAAVLSDEKKWEDYVGLNSKSNRPLFYDKPWRMDHSYLLSEAKKLYGDDLTLLDPFAGSGMIPFEALRMGFNVVAVDYNPVAYMIMMATLVYPKKYGIKLYSDVKKNAEEIMAELKKELGDLYGDKDLAYIWAFTVKCPSCGRETPLVNDWALDRRAELIYTGYKENGELYIGRGGKPPEPTVSGAEGRCAFCGRKISNSEIVKQIREKPREIMIGKLKQNASRYFDVSSESDRNVLERAEERLKNSFRELKDFIPFEEMPTDGTIRAAKYLPLWKDLFNPRQLLLFASMAKKIRERVDRLAESNPEYAKAVGTYLSMWLAKCIDRSSRVTQWHSSGIKIGDSLALRGLSMTWRYAEPNPFARFSGSLSGMLHDVLDGLLFSINELENSGNAVVRLGSAMQLEGKYKLIITDPPYADDVPYGELSDFFYVWHRRTVGHLYGFTGLLTDKSEEIDVGGNRSEDDYWSRFRIATKKLRDALTDDGLLVIFFAHRRNEIWEGVVDSFIRSGLRITMTTPISTENENNVIAQGKRSIYYSLIITARKRLENKVGTLEEVKKEVSERLKERLPELEQMYENQGKLMLAATGVALEVLTQYSEIKSFNMSNAAKTALEFAQEMLMHELIKKDWEKVNGSEPRLDRETEFYLYVLRGKSRKMDYDAFNQMVKASGVNEKLLFEKGLAKKEGRWIEIVGVPERSNIIGSSIIDWVHRLLFDYSVKPSVKLIDEYSAKSGLPQDVLLGVLRMINSYGLGDEEQKIVSKFLGAYKDIRGGYTIERYF
ncbi:MAG: DUF1156 domain-containing protein [Nitrososphaeria archaeon]